MGTACRQIFSSRAAICGEPPRGMVQASFAPEDIRRKVLARIAALRAAGVSAQRIQRTRSTRARNGG
jgi:hypothetical protein